jgi:hypothetical protein
MSASQTKNLISSNLTLQMMSISVPLGSCLSVFPEWKKYSDFQQLL